MVKLVFARHGESEWNKANLFTGWADVDLSEKGTQQAIDAGKLIKEAGIEFDQAYTSVLTRAIKTTNLALEAADQLWVPVEKSWRLNERHYGALQGLNKAETAEKYGLKDGDIVDIQTEGERSVTLHNVLVRAGVKHADEVHIDTDEANACNLGSGVMVNVVTK